MILIKKLFCKHNDVDFVRDIHGDEINAANGMRSLWRCKNCGKYIFLPYLREDVVMLDETNTEVIV